MGAPIGNNFWEFREKHGKDAKYNAEELWTEAVDYFNWANTRVWNKKEPIKTGDLAGTTMDVPTRSPFSIEAFCLYADISFQTFLNYEKKNDYVDVIARIRAIIETNQFEGATVGIYNPNIIARKLGLSEKVDNTLKGDKENPIEQNIKVEIVNGTNTKGD